jgi:uncharacterized protein HemX
MAADGPSGPVPGDDQPSQPEPPPAAQVPPPAPGYPQPAYGAPPPSRQPGAGWWIGAALVAVVLGVGGYLVGHNVGQSNERDNFDAGAPGYNDIYQQGFAAGKDQGTQQGQAQGAAQGEQAGLEQGKQQGQQEGVEQGTSAGATQALGGFTTWEPGAAYVIKVKAGSGSVPYEISSRTQMQPDIDYALCQDDPSQVCTVEEASGTGTP